MPRERISLLRRGDFFTGLEIKAQTLSGCFTASQDNADENDMGNKGEGLQERLADEFFLGPRGVLRSLARPCVGWRIALRDTLLTGINRGNRRGGRILG